MKQRPDYLESCDPKQRCFPDTWKTEYWRLFGDPLGKGYECPLCHNYFKGVIGFKQLSGDHIYPYKQGGLTVWDNFQLICKPCNLKKSDAI